MNTRRRWSLLVVAAAILLLLIAYPWSSECRIETNQVQIAFNRGWVVSRPDVTFATGLAFNVTNYSSCELHLESVTVTVHRATYRDGSVDELEFSETQTSTDTISPGQTGDVTYVFDYLFQFAPVRLSLLVEMSFREAGSIVAFDGEVEIPPRSG